MKNIYIIIFSCFFSFIGFSQEKETPPVGGEPRDFTLPEKNIVELENGLKLVMVQWGSIPKATISTIVRTGNIHEAENQVWLSDVTADMLEEGSKNMTANQIADKMAGFGGELGISVGVHTTVLNSSVLYEFAPEAIKIMADVLINPAFPDSELERLINDRKRTLSIQLQNPQAKAQEEFQKAIYPDHPYGRVFPTDEMLNSYTMEDIKSYYSTQYGAKRTTVYVVGKFQESKVIEAVKGSFSNWAAGPEVSYPIAEPVTAKTIQISDRKDAPQTTIRMGLPVVDPTDPDYIPLSITNSLLGGSFGSRITSNIREDKGYTYSPFSSVNSRYRSAVWYQQADVTTDVTGPALREITKEIIQLQNEAPSQEELDGIINYQAGIFVLQNATPGGIISQLSNMDFHGLPDDYLENYVKNIHSVTPEKVSEMTKKYIKPEDMAIIMVGDKKKIEKQLDEYEKDIEKF